MTTKVTHTMTDDELARWEAEVTAPVPLAEHGTSYTYSRGCRCNACRADHSERNREYRKKKAASAVTR